MFYLHFGTGSHLSLKAASRGTWPTASGERRKWSLRSAFNCYLTLAGWRTLVRLPVEGCSSLEILPGFTANLGGARRRVRDLSAAPVPLVVVGGIT